MRFVDHLVRLTHQTADSRVSFGDILFRAALDKLFLCPLFALCVAAEQDIRQFLIVVLALDELHSLAEFALVIRPALRQHVHSTDTHAVELTERLDASSNTGRRGNQVIKDANTLFRLCFLRDDLIRLDTHALTELRRDSLDE